MRAISAFSFEAGTSSFWWRERIALRMRVRKSATGSVKLMLSPSSSVRSGLCIDQGQRTSEDGVACRLSPVRQVAVRSWPSLPGRLHDTWNLAAQGKPAEAQTAYAELAQECARAAAQRAAVVLARGTLRLPGVFNTFCSGRHRLLVLVSSLCFRGAYAAAVRNGMPNCRSSARAWLSSFAVVTIVMFMPFSFSTRA